MNASRVRAVVRKEFRELRRDPITLWVAFALPLVMLFLFGYAIRMDVDDVAVGVVDLDGSKTSRDLVQALVNSGHYVIRARETDPDRLGPLLDRGVVRVGVVIPRGFERDLLRGTDPELLTVIDGSFSATAAVVRGEMESIVQAFAARLGAPGVSPVAPVRAEPRVWYNPGLRSATSVVPGLFAVILMAFPPLLTVLAIVREKESGSVLQIYASPLRPIEFIAGKLIPYAAIAFAELAMIVAVGIWWFRLPFRGSPWLLAMGAVLYVACTVGIGLLVSTLTNSQVVALLLATIITLMPSMLFSGFMYPIITMVEPVQWYTRLFPARYFTDVSRGVVLKGVGVGALAEQLVWLGVYTVSVVGIAVVRFRNRMA